MYLPPQAVQRARSDSTGPPAPAARAAPAAPASRTAPAARAAAPRAQLAGTRPALRETVHVRLPLLAFLLTCMWRSRRAGAFSYLAILLGRLERGVSYLAILRG